MHLLSRRRIAALSFSIAALGAGAAIAQEPISDARIWRVDEGLVALSFTYQGGACDRTLPAEIGDADQGVVEVTIPTVRIGEICTMNIVPVPFSGVLALDADATGLSITVLNPEGNPVAAGEVELPAAP